MSDIKLITIDIDKTLINDQMQIPSKNKDAIQYAVSKGVNVVICSGRSGSSVRNYMNDLNLKGMVPSLGGCMLQTWDGTIIRDNGIACEDAIEIYKLARKYDIYPYVFKHGDWYSNPENTYWIQREIEATGLTGIYVDLGEFLKTNSPNKMLIPTLNTELIKTVMAEINSKFSKNIVCFTSSSYYVEIMPRGVNKGTAVENLIEYFNITKENVLAIGDYYNDIDMFNAAGHSACPLNAPDDIKKLVEYVSPLDNNNAAVAEIIKRFI